MHVHAILVDMDSSPYVSSSYLPAVVSNELNQQSDNLLAYCRRTVPAGQEFTVVHQATNFPHKLQVSKGRHVRYAGVQ